MIAGSSMIAQTKYLESPGAHELVERRNNVLKILFLDTQRGGSICIPGTNHSNSSLSTRMITIKVLWDVPLYAEHAEVHAN